MTTTLAIFLIGVLGFILKGKNLIPLAMFGIWLGIVLYFSLSKGFLGTYLKSKTDSLKNMSFGQLALLFFIIYLFLSIFTNIIYDYFILDTLLVEAQPNPTDPIDKSIIGQVKTDVKTGPVNTTGVRAEILNRVHTINVGGLNIPGKAVEKSVQFVGDAAIMGPTVATGYQIAMKQPTIAGKAAVVGGAILAGGTAILVKNAAGDLSQKFSHLKSNFINIEEIYSKFFEFTGNSVIDFLALLQLMQKIEFFLIYLIGFYFIIVNIDLINIINKNETFINKYLSKRTILFITKWINRAKLSGKFILGFLILILAFSLYVSNHYFDFLLIHFKEICTLFLKTN